MSPAVTRPLLLSCYGVGEAKILLFEFQPVALLLPERGILVSSVHLLKYVIIGLGGMTNDR